MAQGLFIDLALERHDMFAGIPEIDPAPEVKLRLLVCIQPEMSLISGETEQKPHLLLTDAGRPHMVADIAVGQPVTQPSGRGAQHFDMLGTKPGFLFELAVHRFDGGFVGAHAALRKLPAIPIDPACPENAAIVPDQDDAHVGSVAIWIDHTTLRVLPVSRERLQSAASRTRQPARGRGTLRGRFFHTVTERSKAGSRIARRFSGLFLAIAAGTTELAASPRPHPAPVPGSDACDVFHGPFPTSTRPRRYRRAPRMRPGAPASATGSPPSNATRSRPFPSRPPCRMRECRTRSTAPATRTTRDPARPVPAA